LLSDEKLVDGIRTFHQSKAVMRKLLNFCLLLLSVVLFASCNSLAKGRRSYDRRNYTLAWNEDTVNSYQLVLFDNETFSYQIATADSVQNKAFSFSGEYALERDTLILKYRSGSIPEGLSPRLVVEASGNFFIQYFLNDKRRIYMRIRRPGLW